MSDQQHSVKLLFVANDRAEVSLPALVDARTGMVDVGEHRLPEGIGNYYVVHEDECFLVANDGGVLCLESEDLGELRSVVCD